jgi:methionyl aminopeptidase
MREVGRVVRIVLDLLEEGARPGVTTGDLDRLAAAAFRDNGARSAPALVYNFPAAVLISVNDEVVHGVPGSRRLLPGDVVKLDVTAEKDGYMADAARTVVLAPGERRSIELRACAEAAFASAMTAARAGNRVSDVSRAIEREVRRRGFSVIPELSGHGIGRTIHEPPDVPNYYEAGRTDILTEGLVLAVEPIISAGRGAIVEGADGWTVRTRDGSLAAHYEHTVVITRDEPVLLTAA